MPWVPGAARRLSILPYLLLRASSVILILVWYVYIYMMYLLCTRIIILEGADMPITFCWGNGSIRPTYMLLFGFGMIYFLVRRPDLWELRTVLFILCILFYCSYLWCCWISCIRSYGWCGLYCYLYVSLVDGIGRESALAYLYVYDVSFILRRAVPIFGPGGWLSVKQMDPVSFSAEIELLF